MAPRDESDRSKPDRERHNDKPGSEQNPFVHFRRGVDSMAASIFSDLAEMFPSLQNHVPPPGTSFFEAWNRELFKRFNDSYERATNPERKQLERYRLDEGEETQQGRSRRQWRLGGRRRNHSEPQPEEKQAEPALEAVAADIVSMLAPFQGLFFGNERILTPWKPTVEYLDESEYSPLQLERDPQFAKEGDRWRLAFEDLLRVEHDKPMLPLPSNWRPQRPSRVPYVWVGGLAQKGFVENQGTYPFLLTVFGLTGLNSWQVLQERYRHPKLRENFRAAEQAFFNLPEFPTKEQENAAREYAHELGQSTYGEAETELDLYERWLRSVDEAISPIHAFSKVFGLAEDEDAEDESDEQKDNRTHFSSSSTSSTHTKYSSQEAETEGTKDGEHGLGILSSLTTTERRVLPDGSILTHTTLKKKFADGREEIDEDTTIKPPDETQADAASKSPQAPTPSKQSSRRQRRIAEAAKEQQRKKQEAQKEENKENKDNSGWFWSR